MRINSGEGGIDPATVKPIPRDANTTLAILKDMGIHDFEPRVASHLLEYVYRYITSILDDANLVATHAKKQAIDTDDIKLAVQMYSEENMTGPPGRDTLLEAARSRNTQTLPMPRATSGIRLPPDRFCVTSCNYKLAKSVKKPVNSTTIGRLGSSMFSNQVNPLTPKISLGHLSSQFATPSLGFGLTAQQGARVPMNFQIQPGGSSSVSQPIFSLNLNPSQVVSTNSGQGQKRKATDMENSQN